MLASSYFLFWHLVDVCLITNDVQIYQEILKNDTKIQLFYMENEIIVQEIASPSFFLI